MPEPQYIGMVDLRGGSISATVEGDVMRLSYLLTNGETGSRLLTKEQVSTVADRLQQHFADTGKSLDLLTLLREVGAADD